MTRASPGAGGLDRAKSEGREARRLIAASARLEKEGWLASKIAHSPWRDKENVAMAPAQGWY